MNMVGHHHKRIQGRMRKMIGNGLPARMSDPPHTIELHAPVDDVPEQAPLPVGADGDEIASR